MITHPKKAALNNHANGTPEHEADIRGTNVVHFANPDTARLIILAEVLALREAGVNVSVLTGVGPRADEVRGYGIPVATVPFTRRLAPLQDLKTLIAVTRYLRKTRPTVLHTHNPKPNLIGLLAGRIAGVPVRVNTVHGRYNSATLPPPLQWAVALAERLQLRMAHRVLVVNEEDAVSFAASGKDGAKVLHIGGGISLERFDPARFDPGRVAVIREGLGIPSGHVVVGTVGRLVREKGYPELFDAFRRVRAENPSVTLLVVGMEDPEKPDAMTRDAVRDYGIEDAVVFAGPEATPELYAAMDVFILASHREGMPRTPMEAAAMGKPLVLTNIRGCRQIVRSGENGILVPVKDPGALVAGIANLITNAQLRARYGENARRRAISEFDHRRVVDATIAVYRDELQKKREAPLPTDRRRA